jgi:hypothetical protein
VGYYLSPCGLRRLPSIALAFYAASIPRAVLENLVLDDVDDELHRSVPQTLEVLEFAAEVLDGVVYPDVMSFEEPVEFVTGSKAQEAAQH